MDTDPGKLWDFADPVGSERRFTDALAQPSIAGDALLLAVYWTQIARARGLQRRFEDAAAALAEAERLAGAGDSVAAVRILLERGRVLNSSGHAADAVGPFESAWAMARRMGAEALAVDAAHMLGIVEPGEAGLAWNRRALELAEASTDPAARRWTASLRNNIGWWLHERGRFDQALTEFERAREDRERQGVRGPLLIARWAVARCLRSLGRFEEALAAQSALAQEHERDGTSDGYVHEEMGECLLSLGRVGEARAYFQRAYELLGRDAHLVASEPARLSRLAELGGAKPAVAKGARGG